MCGAHRETRGEAIRCRNSSRPCRRWGCAPILHCESQTRYLHTIRVLLTTDCWAGSAHQPIEESKERRSAAILWLHPRTNGGICCGAPTPSIGVKQDERKGIVVMPSTLIRFPSHKL